MMDTFETRDIYISAFLVIEGFRNNVVSTSDGRQFYFQFDNLEGLNDKVELFRNGKALVEPMQYANMIKNLKAKLEEARRTYLV